MFPIIVPVQRGSALFISVEKHVLFINSTPQSTIHVGCAVYIYVELLHNIIASNLKFLKRLASHKRNLLTPCRDVCIADLDE